MGLQPGGGGGGRFLSGGGGGGAYNRNFTIRVDGSNSFLNSDPALVSL